MYAVFQAKVYPTFWVHVASAAHTLRLCVRPHSLYPNYCPVYKPLQTASGEEICLKVNSPWWALTRAARGSSHRSPETESYLDKERLSACAAKPKKHTDDAMTIGASVIGVIQKENTRVFMYMAPWTLVATASLLEPLVRRICANQ